MDKTIRSGPREIIYQVFLKCLAEFQPKRREKKLLFDLEDVYKRTANMTDSDNSQGLEVDEQYRKFRPSPNFKNMKKFIKNKIDYSESSSQFLPNGRSEQTTPTTASESPLSNDQSMEKQENQPIVHSPLPLEPPLLDSPPVMPMPIENEIMHTNYQDQENVQESLNLSTADTEEVSLRLSIDRSNAGPEVCRDFVRGTCKRAPCRYAHHVVPSQLKGIYTFCWNYQNSICTYPKCKYVHATVFEEQEFYRTGFLPPHVSNYTGSSRKFYKHLTFPEAPPEVQNASALSPPQSNSLQYNKHKLESMESNTEELQLKTQLLNKKSQALYTVLFTVIKEKAATVAGRNALIAKLSLCGEKQREALLQILERNITHFSNMM